MHDRDHPLCRGEIENHPPVPWKRRSTAHLLGRREHRAGSTWASYLTLPQWQLPSTFIVNEVALRSTRSGRHERVRRMARAWRHRRVRPSAPRIWVLRNTAIAPSRPLSALATSMAPATIDARRPAEVLRRRRRRYKPSPKAVQCSPGRLGRASSKPRNAARSEPSLAGLSSRPKDFMQCSALHGAGAATTTAATRRRSRGSRGLSFMALLAARREPAAPMPPPMPTPMPAL
jgi:hypothetical protein